ncbi:MAG: ABC transporter ATP-binding protein [Candidatus Hodarchaeota archaeon]
MESIPDIVIEDVSFTYQGSEQAALQNINLRIEPGEIVMLSGPAGAGKTTLCQMLNGLVPHFFRGNMTGNVAIHGHDTRKNTIAYLSQRVGLLFQDPAAQLIAPTVNDEIAFGAENYGIPRDKIIERVEKFRKLVRLDRYASTSPHRLSGGEQQACAIAAVMAMHPDIYVLDEPTSNLDPIGSHRVLDLITTIVREEKKTMLIVEHKMEELLPIIDRLIILNEGKIILEGTPRELLHNVQLMEKIGLKPPQVALLASKINSDRIGSELPLTLDEAITTFKSLLRKQDGAPVLIEEKKEVSLGEEILRTQSLWHVYEEGEVHALRGIDLSIKAGDFVGIIGQNGSGKTTLVKHFNRLLLPSYGDVWVMGENTKDRTIAQLSTQVGYVFQNPDFQICCQSVKEEMEFGPKNLKLNKEEIERRRDEVAKLFGFDQRLDEKPFSLSKGERQKLAVASVLAMRPEVLIVDEPTTGQDFRTGNEMMEFYRSLNKAGKTVIIITHDMNLAAEYCNRIIVLRNGRILLDGPVREVYSQSEVLARSFIHPPQITRFGQALDKYGLPINALNVDEMFQFVSKLM